MLNKKNKRHKKITKESIKKQIFENYKNHIDKYDNLIIVRENKIITDILVNPSVKERNKKLKFKSSIPGGYKPSKGESAIELHLKLNKIAFIKEVVVKGLVNPKTKYPLRFDFYLPQLNTCIEFDGEQHFRVVEDFEGDDITLLVKRRELDKVKTNFCKSNNIKLIRIKYTEFNKINKIISKLKWMKILKQYSNYIEENGFILPGVIILILLIAAILDAIYSLAAFASMCLITLFIFSIIKFVSYKNNKYLYHKLRR